MPTEKWAPYWGGVENPSGLYHSLLNTIADSLNYTIIYRGYDSFDEIFQALENNQVDATIGFVRNGERKRNFNFTEPVLSLKKVIWLRDDALREEPFSEWEWVCVEGGLDCEVIQGLGATKITTSEKIGIVSQIIKQGAADAALTTIMEVEQYINDPIHSKGRLILNKNIGTVKIGLMVAKENIQLKAILDKAIQTNQLALKSSRLSNIHLLNESTQWELLQNQQKSKTIRYTISSKAYPLSYYDPKTQRVEGYIHDLLDLLEKKTLFSFEYVPTKGRNVEDMLKDGTVDLLPGHYTHQLDNTSVLTTQAYTSTDYGLIETRDQYSERKLGILDPTNVLCRYIDRIRLYEPLTVYTNTAALLEALNSGDITHALVDQTIIDNYINHYREPYFRTIDKPRYMDFTTPLTMVVRKDSELLHNMLSRTLSITSGTEIDTLKSLHNNLIINYGYDKETINSYVVWIVIASSIMMLGAVILFYTLSKLLKRTQKINQLSQNEVNWLSTLLDNMPSMILITDRHGKVVFTNSAYINTIQQCRCEPNKSKHERCPFIAQALAQQNSAVFQFPNCDCLLANRHFNIRHQIITHPDHGSKHHMTVIDDISEDKQKEEELQISNQRAMKAISARNEFLAVVSHELRTPIAAMLGLMELLQFNLRNQQDIELLKNAIQSAQRLKTQVNEILDFSKIEASQLQIDIRCHNLYSELCPTLRGYETATQLKGLKFVLNWVPSEVIRAEFDALRTNQILGNVLSNALKFTDIGSIEVFIHATTSTLTISVQDSGCGMNEQQINSVFEPFIQADKGISRRYGGTGLGMSITKNLVELMGGTIDVSSMQSQGTLVSCTIPLVMVETPFHEAQVNPSNMSSSHVQGWLAAWQHQPLIEHNEDRHTQENFYPDKLYDLHQIEAAKQGETQSLTIEKPKGKVLVADDDRINQMLLHKQLTLLGVDFHIVESGQEAFDYLVEHKSDISLVLTDCHMPDVDGFQLTKSIKTHYQMFGLLPVIGCTAEDSRVVAEKAHHCGMNDVLYKPYTLEGLRQVLSPYLSETEEPIIVVQDEHLGWLSTHPSHEQLEMASVVLQSFSQEMQFLNDSNSKDDTVIHRIKGSSSLLNMTTLTTLSKQYEKSDDAEQKNIIKQSVISELSTIKNKITLWLNERQ
ncbi:transporter substrate-binding domain-containing protein [Vibrio sp. 404]|uniref:histidine kinase n=1 Tax=Vibrio marinisediminis TaxID=2758441 RepID=A0A7W2IT45_9VIBR|nr:transporter substrate-binding domain-containing protein [Vibrio marinisediminis]MBA5761783.1 transporter substrate-binding domain-containing protein [Vibrio marinisediminis]